MSVLRDMMIMNEESVSELVVSLLVVICSLFPCEQNISCKKLFLLDVFLKC